MWSMATTRMSTCWSASGDTAGVRFEVKADQRGKFITECRLRAIGHALIKRQPRLLDDRDVAVDVARDHPVEFRG